jgi:hypothetical protein
MSLQIVLNELKTKVKKVPARISMNNKDLPTCTDTREMARNAVQMTFGTENKYIENLIQERLEGKERYYARLPLSQIVHGIDRRGLKKQLNQDIIQSQQKAIDMLRNIPKTPVAVSKNCEVKIDMAPQPEQDHIVELDETADAKPPRRHRRHKHREVADAPQSESEPDPPATDPKGSVATWILNTVLQEKLKDREARESSDYWKYINGGLAIILPIATGLIDHFLTKYFMATTCSGSGGGT